MATKSGKAGTLLINSVAAKVTDWRFDASQGISDATDSGSPANFTNHVLGRRQARFSVSGYVHTDDLPNAKFTLGTQVTTVHLTIDGTIKYVVPTATCTSLRVSAPIRSGDTLTFEAEFQVDGSYTELT